MNWRAAGCLVIGAGSFVALGLLGLSLALNRGEGCPPNLQWAERIYAAEGTPAASPAFPEKGSAVQLGSTFIGLSTRFVYGPPGSSPSERAADRPDRIALDCADGSFQSYRYSGDLSPLPTASSGAP